MPHSPWNGRDALDGVMLMDAGMAQYREHMQPSMRAHRVVTNGGDQPNVIPRTARSGGFFRGPQRRRRDWAVRAGQEDRAGRSPDEQHDLRRQCAQRGVAAALQSHRSPS